MLALKLRHAWGAPKDWPLLQGEDEAIALRALKTLGNFAVEDANSDEQILLASDEDGPVGAWNREGARQFAGALNSEQSPILQIIRQDLLLAVSAG